MVTVKTRSNQVYRVVGTTFRNRVEVIDFENYLGWSTAAILAGEYISGENLKTK